jgi:hypothetical protein
MLFFLNVMQKDMLYVQSFTLIKSTGVSILSPGTQTGGIPSPTVQNIHYRHMSLVYFRSARLTHRYDFWISPIGMNLRLRRYDVQYRFFCTQHFLFDE